MKDKKVRIKDIAQLAGVSVGTVDRVLHRRGKVSEEALQKVLATLHQIDYQPNLIARSLGSQKIYRIAAILPEPSADEYWFHSNEGIEQAAAEWSQFDFRVEIFYFDLYDRTSFARVAAVVLAAPPDGILIAPIFYRETRPFFDACQASGIPYVLFNTNIPETQPLSFIGQNVYESGRVAAELMQWGPPAPGTLAIVHINNEELDNAVHLLEKERGFREYFQELRTKDSVLRTLKITSLEEEKIQKQLTALFTEAPLRGIFVTSSKGTTGVAAFLAKHGKGQVRLIGYDLLQENVAHLQNGTIDFLIHQNPKRQAYLGTRYLANHLFLKKAPPAQDLFPLEIITRQNVKSYLEARIY